MRARRVTHLGSESGAFAGSMGQGVREGRRRGQIVGGYYDGTELRGRGVCGGRSSLGFESERSVNGADGGGNLIGGITEQVGIESAPRC